MPSYFFLFRLQVLNEYGTASSLRIHRGQWSVFYRRPKRSVRVNILRVFSRRTHPRVPENVLISEIKNAVLAGLS